MGNAGPGTFRGRSHQPKDLLQLVFVRRSREEGSSRVHLCHDTTCGPDVDAGVVGPATQEDVRGTIPQGDNLVGERVDGDTEGPCKTEIGELELALLVDEEVLGFEVSVEDAILVAEGDAPKELVHERLDGDIVQLPAVAIGVHVLLQVLVHVLEDEHQFVFRVDDIVEGDDALVLQLLHQRDLADGRRRRSLLRVKVDLLQGHHLAGLAIPSLEDLRRSVSAEGKWTEGHGAEGVLNVRLHRYLLRATDTQLASRTRQTARRKKNVPFPAAGKSSAAVSCPSCATLAWDGRLEEKAGGSCAG